MLDKLEWLVTLLETLVLAVIKTVPLTSGEQMHLSSRACFCLSLQLAVEGYPLPLNKWEVLGYQGQVGRDWRRKWKVVWTWRGRTKVDMAVCMQKVYGRLPALSPCFSR